MKKLTAVTIAIVGAGLMMTNVARAQHAHDHGEEKETAKEVTVTGEVVDMACYLDHGAAGEKHAACARECIESGLPVGIKATDGQTYLLIGEHKPMNKELVKYAAKTITVRGKLVSRDGFNMIANAEIVTTDKPATTVFTCPMHPSIKQANAGKCPICGMNLVEKK